MKSAAQAPASSLQSRAAGRPASSGKAAASVNTPARRGRAGASLAGDTTLKDDHKRGALLSTIWSLIEEPPTAREAGKAHLPSTHIPRAHERSSFPVTGPQAHALIMRGISPKTVALLGDVLGVGVRNVTAYLDIDRGTPARQEAKGQPLPRHASEGVLRLLEIEQLAHDTFEAEDATPWLNRAHPLLGGQTPLQVAGTSYGAEQVKSILVAIRYGGAV